MKAKALSLAFVCFLAGNSSGQEAATPNVFTPEKLVDDSQKNQLSKVAGQKDFTIRFEGGSKNRFPVSPILYQDKIGSENFTLEYSWKTNNPDLFSSPDLSLGELGGPKGGPFITFDCNGVRLVLSSLDPCKKIKDYDVKDEQGNPVYTSPDYTCFWSSLNRPKGKFNHTKIVFYKQRVTVYQNQILAYSFSLQDQRAFLKAQRKQTNGPNLLGSPNYRSIFYGQVVEELINANKQASLFLSFQEDFRYKDHELCEVQFKDFSIRLDAERIDQTKFLQPRAPRELALQDPFLKNLFAREPAGLPKSTKQMPLLVLKQGVATIQTPSLCANGIVFFPSRMRLGIPQEAFFFNPDKGFMQDFEFPPVWVNHWYNNGSIYLFAFEDGLVWNRGEWDQFFKEFHYLTPRDKKAIRGANQKMNLVVLMEEEVPVEVEEYFKEKIKAWEKK